MTAVRSDHGHISCRSTVHLTLLVPALNSFVEVLTFRARQQESLKQELRYGKVLIDPASSKLNFKHTGCSIVTDGANRR